MKIRHPDREREGEGDGEREGGRGREGGREGILYSNIYFNDVCHLTCFFYVASVEVFRGFILMIIAVALLIPSGMWITNESCCMSGCSSCSVS